jgi:hypothetical protein
MLEQDLHDLSARHEGLEGRQVSYLQKKLRPDTIYWVGTERGHPLSTGAQHVYVNAASAKGLLTQWRNRRGGRRVTQGPPEPQHIYVGTVTWGRLDD